MFISFTAFAASCATVSNISVNNASGTDDLKQASFLYALPQTVIDVTVVAEEVTIIPGPFEKYANKYLGIQHVPSRNEKINTLKSITISLHVEADPDYIYVVEGINDPYYLPSVANLLKDSLILTASGFSTSKTVSYNWPSSWNDILYTDLSVKRNFEAEKDIEISMVLPDTNYATPSPSSRNALKEKNLEQKAEEAANFLIKLKKRRFKLVAGQYENMPEGESMESALNELARIEQEYLALFIGRRISNEIKRVYHFTPDPEKDENRSVIFRFSAQRGILNANETEGIPVTVDIISMNKLRELRGAILPARLPINTLPYRVPDQVNLKVLAGEQIWAEALLPVYQYGAPVSLTLSK
jgi:hypothetical protein